MTIENKKRIRSDLIGGGWVAGAFDDGSVMLSNRSKGLAHYLSPAEVTRFREIMNEIESAKAVAK